MALTDLEVKRAKATDKPQKMADGGGMYLLVQPDSVKINEKKKKITIRRSQQIKTAREALLFQMAEVRRTPLPAAIEYLKPSQVDLFGKALRNKLLAKDSVLAKGYIQLLVEEILVKNEKAIIKGSYAALAQAMHKMKMNTSNQVPTFMPNWCARHDECGHWVESISFKPLQS